MRASESGIDFRVFGALPTASLLFGRVLQVGGAEKSFGGGAKWTQPRRAGTEWGVPGGFARQKEVLVVENQNNSLGNSARTAAAFERVKADLFALSADELQQVSLDITAAFSTVMGVLPEVRALRDQMVKDLPAFDVARFDKLEDYALALAFTQSKYLLATQPPDDLEPLSLQNLKYRERLLAEATAMSLHGLVNSAQLQNLKGANGKKNVATDVWMLSDLLLDNWDKLQGRALSTREDIQKANDGATRVLEIMGLREQGPAIVAEAADRRLRAFTLLMVTYEDAQRAVTYLRGTKNDADTIIPNLHPGRPGARKKAADDTQVTPGPVAPAAPGSGPGASTATPAASVGATPASIDPAIRKNGPFAS